MFAREIAIDTLRFHEHISNCIDQVFDDIRNVLECWIEVQCSRHALDIRPHELNEADETYLTINRNMSPVGENVPHARAQSC